MLNSILMTQFAASVAKAMDIEKPEQADDPFSILDELSQEMGVKSVDKILIHNPDAIGMWLFQKYTQDFGKVLKHTQIGVPVKTMMPSVTPVCFGTMYTGVAPHIHGIQEYAKRVLTVDSFFDAALRAGKKIALVAVEESSMEVLFSKKNLDYFIMPYDNEVKEKALQLIEKNEHDIIIAYTQQYDDDMHAFGPESAQAMQALHNQINIFDTLASAAKKAWKNQNLLICWATDHGIHEVPGGVVLKGENLPDKFQNKKYYGMHGDNIPEDLNVMHFFGIHPKED